MSGTRDLVIVGAGGFALEVLGCVEAINHAAMEAGEGAHWRIIGLADDRMAGAAAETTSYDLLCRPDEIAATCGPHTFIHIAVGDNKARRDLASKLAAQALAAATLVSPKADISPHATLGAGTFVAANAVVAPQAAVGQHVILNVGSVVGHEARLGDYAQVSPNGVVTGRCIIGEGGYLGSNASIYPTCTVGDYAAIASNSFAVGDVAAGETVIGVPAKGVFKRK
ncbi:MAG: hypothetical protein AAF494_11585 [Pseudomonadota bacterium]